MRQNMLAGLMGMVGIGVLALLTQVSGTPLILGSFGATCVILGLTNSPFATPKAIIGGHVLASLVGLICLNVLGSQWWAMGIAVGAAILAMRAAGVVHPPAGSNPVIIMLTHPNWTFLLFPTLTGAALLVGLALIKDWGCAKGRVPSHKPSL